MRSGDARHESCDVTRVTRVMRHASRVMTHLEAVQTVRIKTTADNQSLRPNTDSSAFSNELTVVCQGRFTHRLTEVTKKASNSFDQARLEHPPCPAKPAIGQPSFPCRPGSSTLIDDQLEGLLIEEQARHGPRKGDMKGDQSIDRSTSIFCMIPCTDC
jgi:hypothetical protein